MLAPSQLVNATVVTTISKRLCQHTADELMIQSTRAGLGRRHLAFAVANYLLNWRFATGTVGSCGICWKLRRVAGKACNMMENVLYILIVFFRTTPTNRDLRQKAVSFLAGLPTELPNGILFIKQYFQIKITNNLQRV